MRGKYVEYVTLYFEGGLPIIPVELSHRMRKQLARVEAINGKPFRLVMSAHHIHLHGWKAAQETLLHELIHVWQVTRRKPMHHDRGFREQATRIGVVAAAKEYMKPMKRCHLK